MWRAQGAGPAGCEAWWQPAGLELLGGPLADEEELRSIELKILDEVNAQDKILCERIQRGVGTHGYRPGPLSLEESCIHDFHERVRECLPVTRRSKAPARGELDACNRQLTKPVGG